MPDVNVRELERGLETADPEARTAWISGVIRAGDPCPARGRAFLERLREGIERARRATDALHERRRADCPPVEFERVVEVLEEALQARPEFESFGEFGYGMANLVLYEPRSSGRWRRKTALAALAVRSEGALVLALGPWESSNPKPPQAFTLAWGAHAKPSTRAGNLLGWHERTNPTACAWGERVSTEDARWAVEVFRHERGEEPAPPPKPALRPDQKVDWSGEVLVIQHRASESTEEGICSDGYTFLVQGALAGETQTFRVGIGFSAMEKHAFGLGDRVSGAAWPVADRAINPCDVYRASKLKVVERGPKPEKASGPPYRVPVSSEHTYVKEPRRLALAAYEAEPCAQCAHACTVKRGGELERGCYGPTSCSAYQRG